MSKRRTPKETELGLPWKLEVEGATLRVTRAVFDFDNDDIAVLGDTRVSANHAQGELIVRACNGWHNAKTLRARLAELEARP